MIQSVIINGQQITVQPLSAYHCRHCHRTQAIDIDPETGQYQLPCKCGHCGTVLYLQFPSGFRTKTSKCQTCNVLWRNGRRYIVSKKIGRPKMSKKLQSEIDRTCLTQDSISKLTEITGSTEIALDMLLADADTILSASKKQSKEVNTFDNKIETLRKEIPYAIRAWELRNYEESDYKHQHEKMRGQKLLFLNQMLDLINRGAYLSPKQLEYCLTVVKRAKRFDTWPLNIEGK